MAKLIEKLAYVALLFSLNTGYIFTRMMTALHFLLPRKKKLKDVIFFPYMEKGSIGYTLRFEQYFPYFQRDGLTYKMASIMPLEKVTALYEGGAVKQFYLYHKVYWKRFFQVLQARNYKAAFVQRSLFVFYPDLKVPYLEKLLRKVNRNITFDYWDAVWLNNEAIFEKIVKQCDTLSCVNHFIINHFKPEKAHKVLFPIGLDLNKYVIKTSYEILGKVKLFYTGQPYNLSVFLKFMEPALRKLKKTQDIKLVIVSRGRMQLEGIEIEYHDYDEQTFFNIQAGCDIGLFALEKTEVGMGKMAMKTLDYMAGGLPAVVSPVGLSPYIINNENALFAETEQEWLEKLNMLIDNRALRERLGKAARRAMEEHHNLTDSYLILKKLIKF